MKEDVDGTSSDYVFETKRKSSHQITSPQIRKTKHKNAEVMQVQIKRGKFVKQQLKEEIMILRTNL